MNELELSNLQAKVKIEVFRQLIKVLYVAAVQARPDAEKSFRQLFANMRATGEELRLKNYPPEQSMLIAAEYQDALDSILSEIEAAFDSLP
jgi:hypothetical protein